MMGWLTGNDAPTADEQTPASEEAAPVTADLEATAPGIEPPAPAPEESAAPTAPEVAAQVPVPRYTQDGILLNPEEFNVSPDGILTPKQG